MEVLRPKVNGTMESSAIGAELFLSVVEKCLIDVPFHFLQQRHHRFFIVLAEVCIYLKKFFPAAAVNVFAFASFDKLFHGHIQRFRYFHRGIYVRQSVVVVYVVSESIHAYSSFL